MLRTLLLALGLASGSALLMPAAPLARAAASVTRVPSPAMELHRKGHVVRIEVELERYRVQNEEPLRLMRHLRDMLESGSVACYSTARRRPLATESSRLAPPDVGQFASHRRDTTAW